MAGPITFADVMNPNSIGTIVSHSTPISSLNTHVSITYPSAPAIVESPGGLASTASPSVPDELGGLCTPVVIINVPEYVSLEIAKILESFERHWLILRGVGL